MWDQKLRKLDSLLDNGVVRLTQLPMAESRRTALINSHRSTLLTATERYMLGSVD